MAPGLMLEIYGVINYAGPGHAAIKGGLWKKCFPFRRKAGLYAITSIHELMHI
jgi:hypothetical protein